MHAAAAPPPWPHNDYFPDSHLRVGLCTIIAAAIRVDDEAPIEPNHGLQALRYLTVTQAGRLAAS